MDNPLRFRTKGTLSEFEILELQEQNRKLYLKEKTIREKIIREKKCPNCMRAKIALEEARLRVN